MDRPNVLFITTHDTGRCFGCYGVPEVTTPNLDQFAADGWRFDNYFAVSTLCSPSRGAAMTGCYPQTNGMMNLCHALWAWRLNPGQKHLSHHLHEAGYYTILLGHQHETVDVDRDLCFDHHDLFRYPETWTHVECNEVADGACDFLKSEAAAKAPFYLQMGFFETHRPYDFGGAKPDSENGIHIPRHMEENDALREDMAAFQGNLKKVDAAIGRVLHALDEAGLRENTIVVYTVDHGLALPRAKATLYDPGMEIALLMRWPAGGIDGGNTCDRMLSNVDIMPTVLELADVTPAESFDGKSFAHLFGDSPAQTPDAIFGIMEHIDARCVRTERYKLIRHFGQHQLPVPPVRFKDADSPRKPMQYVQLYDLQADPLEHENLAENPEHGDVLADLDERLTAWLKQVDDPILKGPIVSPYYTAAMKSLA